MNAEIFHRPHGVGFGREIGSHPIYCYHRAGDVLFTMIFQLSGAVSFDDGYCLIKHPSGHVYDFSIKKIRTAEQLLGWVRHLAEKSWITGPMLFDVVTGISSINDINVPSAT